MKPKRSNLSRGMSQASRAANRGAYNERDHPFTHEEFHAARREEERLSREETQRLRKQYDDHEAIVHAAEVARRREG